MHSLEVRESRYGVSSQNTNRMPKWRKVLNKIPFMLVISRAIIGIIIFMISFTNVKANSLLILCLMIFGFLSDFFDGYMARLLGVSSQFLRRLDTIVDRIFWLSILYSAWILANDFLISRIYWIIFVLILEVINYLISFMRFRKEISTHALLSKFWAVSLLLGFCDLILHGSSSFLFDFALLLGVLSRIDTGLIMLILPRWDHDIPSFYHAIRIRNGKVIKRYRIFNG